MGLEYKWNLGHIPDGADGEHENMERMLWDLHWLLKHMFPGLLELEVGSVMLIQVNSDEDEEDDDDPSWWI